MKNGLLHKNQLLMQCEILNEEAYPYCFQDLVMKYSTMIKITISN